MSEEFAEKMLAQKHVQKNVKTCSNNVQHIVNKCTKHIHKYSTIKQRMINTIQTCSNNDQTIINNKSQ